MNSLVVLPHDEHLLHLRKVTDAMALSGIDSALISTSVNLYYLTGRVYSGYIYISTAADPVYFVKRPVGLTGDRIIEIRKPENILEALADLGITPGTKFGLELNAVSYNTAMRLAAALGAGDLADASRALAYARATKTPYEIEKIRVSALHQIAVYHHIPQLYHFGMSDMELQYEIEHKSRLEGCLGQFRIAGDDMELHMGNILAGDNADTPSPYDFAMGGAGADPSLPVGANGTIIRPGMVVMVDVNGNYTGYMDDMTRCFAVGKIPQKAIDAHNLSIDICHRLAELGRVGTPAKLLYDTALEMSKAAGYEDYFMGHRQHAKFVGHGVGIEVNELPVLAPRSRDILAEGNVIAVEPKFVIPGCGAVGIENTYVVKAEGHMQCLTNAEEQLINLE